MKITNFRLLERIGTNALSWRFKAVVSVKTGFIFKKTEDREIQKEYACSWVFSDNGEFTPGHDVESLQKSFEAKYMKRIEFIEIINQPIK